MPTLMEGMMLSTKRSNRPSEYIVLANGRDTGLRVSKGEPAKYGMAQEWDVCSSDDTYLFSAKGKATCVAVIEDIVQRVTGAA